jgi:hypothetical protein
MFEKENAERNNESEPELNLVMSMLPGDDKNRYNPKWSNDVAVVCPKTDDGDIPDSYVVVYSTKEQRLRRLSTMNPFVEPFV